MMHQTLALHHLNFFASSPTEALAAIERRLYPQQHNTAKIMAIIGGGAFVSSIPVFFYLMFAMNNVSNGSEKGPPRKQDISATGGDLSGVDKGGSIPRARGFAAIGTLIAGFAFMAFSSSNLRTVESKMRSIVERKPNPPVSPVLNRSELTKAI